MAYPKLHAFLGLLRKYWRSKKQASLPTPDAGEMVLGFKSDGKLYSRNESGVETAVAMAGDAPELVSASGAATYELATALVQGHYLLVLKSEGANNMNTFSLQFYDPVNLWNHLTDWVRRNLVTTTTGSVGTSSATVSQQATSSHDIVGTYTFTVDASGKFALSGETTGFTTNGTFSNASTWLVSAKSGEGYSGVTKIRIAAATTGAFSIELRRLQ